MVPYKLEEENQKGRSPSEEIIDLMLDEVQDWRMAASMFVFDATGDERRLPEEFGTLEIVGEFQR